MLQHYKRNRYGVPDPENRCDSVPEGASLTKQGEAWETDINVIMARYVENPDPRIFREGGGFEDVSDLGDFQRCMNVVQEAQESFAELPAVVRDHFANSPEAFAAAFFDPARRAELEGLGLVKPKAVEPQPSNASGVPAAGANSSSGSV